ncbi:MAG: (Fe-S)-binding protein [Elusimicrobia bacterium]|nr:(Fe-S)-binding protein [Elusimicrobiota bacterium]
MAYLNEIRIISVLPCVAKPGTIRFISELDRDISEVLPYLNSVLEGAIYNHDGHNITLKKDDRLIGIHGRQLSAGKVIDLKDADNLINWFRDLVNNTYSKKDAIKPNYERRKKLTVLDILKLMPLTNCKKCGEITCTAFAIKLAAEEKHIMTCADLFSGKFNEKRDILLNLMKQCGYKTLSIFLKEDD